MYAQSRCLMARRTSSESIAHTNDCVRRLNRLSKSLASAEAAVKAGLAQAQEAAENVCPHPPPPPLPSHLASEARATVALE